jgi:hypothetical protein
MPRPQRAPHKRRRSWQDDWIVLPQPTRAELIRGMDKPLAEAIGFVGALRVMGQGLADLGRDEGSAILAVSDAAHERLQLLQHAWLGLVQAGSGRK